MTPVKYAVGVDVSKDSLHCSFGAVDGSQTAAIGRSKRFANSPAGFRRLLDWTDRQRTSSSVSCWFLIEATGVYYEQLAFFLAEHDRDVSVVLPQRARDYVRSTETKTKTDAVDARMLTRMALERKLEPWNLPSSLMRDIKMLSRERISYVDARTQVQNRIHAMQNSYQPNDATMRRHRQMVKHYDAMIEEVERELAELLDQDPGLKEQVSNAASIKGVGTSTVLTVLSETNGFALSRSVKQVVSYAGLDIVQNQSGLHQGASRISKQGNRRIRRALYVPAMSAIQHNPHMKTFYLRLVQRNGGNRMSALVAVMRKLLRLIYSLFKNNVPYDPNYNRSDAILRPA